jgi:hypothetical protein
MPLGLVRPDVNTGSDSPRGGTPVTLPKNYGTPVTLPHEFGTTIPVSDPTLNSNPVDWQTPDPAHFGNIIVPGDTPQQEAPSFDPTGGNYTGTQNVTITSAGATAIYYTTDNSTPTNPPTGTTQTYSGPVEIDETLFLQALAVRPGFTDSDITGQLYSITVPVELVAHAIASTNAGTDVTTPAKDTTGATLLIVAFANYGGTDGAKGIHDSKNNDWHLLTEYDAGDNHSNPTASILIAYAFDSGGNGSPLQVGAGHTITGTSAIGTNAIAMQAWSNTTPQGDAYILGSDAGQTAATGGGGTIIAPGDLTPSTTGDILITAIGFAANSDPTVDAGFTISDFIGSSSEHLGMAYLVAPDGGTVSPSWTIGFGGAMAANVAGFRQTTVN